MVPCRFTDAWLCTLFRKEGDKNIVDLDTCKLCMQAKEIMKAVEVLTRAVSLCGEMNAAIRTMNTYTLRLTRALEKMEAAAKALSIQKPAEKT